MVMSWATRTLKNQNINITVHLTWTAIRVIHDSKLLPVCQHDYKDRNQTLSGGIFSYPQQYLYSCILTIRFRIKYKVSKVEVRKTLTRYNVPAPVNSISVTVVIGKKSCMMSFLNHNKCNRGLIIWLQRCTCLIKLKSVQYLSQL